MAEKTAAEIAAEAEHATGQSTASTEADAKSTEVDYEVLYNQAKKDAEERAKEAANWRKGYEKYKSIAKEKVGTVEDDDQPSVAELVQQEVSRALADSQAEKARVAAEEIALKAMRENRELKKSLANRPLSNTNQTVSQEGIAVRDASISPAKEKELLARFSGDEETKKRKLAHWKETRLRS